MTRSIGASKPVTYAWKMVNFGEILENMGFNPIFIYSLNQNTHHDQFLSQTHSKGTLAAAGKKKTICNVPCHQFKMQHELQVL